LSLNVLAVHDQITAKLEELPQDVYETAAPDDSKLKFDSAGNLLPYLVVQYSDMYPTPLGNGILSAKYNAAESYFIVTCVSSNQRASRQVADLVKNNIIGFQPTDAGEVRFAGGSTDYSMQVTKPNNYVVELGFILQVNTAW